MIRVPTKEKELHSLSLPNNVTNDFLILLIGNKVLVYFLHAKRTVLSAADANF